MAWSRAPSLRIGLPRRVANNRRRIAPALTGARSEGRQAGREDKTRRNAWDLEGQRELEQADSGYTTQVGSRSDYQAGYRDGFRRAYAEGFGPH